jgi:hypothetical protein
VLWVLRSGARWQDLLSASRRTRPATTASSSSRATARCGVTGGAGDDIAGLNRAFMYAGAPTIVASLWSVPERQTGELMLSFFTHLSAGKSKAEALAAAQAEIRSRHPNPYFWAAFVLTGDGGTSVSNSYVRHYRRHRGI